MEARIADQVWTIEKVVSLLDCTSPLVHNSRPNKQSMCFHLPRPVGRLTVIVFWESPSPITNHFTVCTLRCFYYSPESCGLMLVFGVLNMPRMVSGAL